MTWTTEQVLALSPDSSSSKAASKLTTLAKWSNVGANSEALWGECKGSGKKPYQTRVDLSEPAFKCSCPSRKFPCKHGLALFLLWLQEQQAFSSSEAPAWVTEWLESRQQRAESKAKKTATQKTKAKDPEAAAKRAKKRTANITAGVQELELWLHDAARQGLASLLDKPRGYWNDLAARLVNAQAPGLANRVRTLAQESHSERLMDSLGQLHLLIQGYKRLEQLEPSVQAEVNTLIGLNQDQEALLAAPGLFDSWQVLGQTLTEENNLKTLRTWLFGTTHQHYALLLDFAHGATALNSSAAVNTCVEAELVFFAGLAPRRALIKSKGEVMRLSSFTGLTTLAAAQEVFIETLSCNPWLDHLPLSLQNMVVIKDGVDFLLRDSEKNTIPISANWQLLALSGGHPVTLFGEWDGEHFSPMNLSLGQRCVRLT